MRLWEKNKWEGKSCLNKTLTHSSMMFKLKIPFLQTKCSYESSLINNYLAQEQPIPERSKKLILPFFFPFCVLLLSACSGRVKTQGSFFLPCPLLQLFWLKFFGFIQLFLTDNVSFLSFLERNRMTP